MALCDEVSNIRQALLGGNGALIGALDYGYGNRPLAAATVAAAAGAGTGGVVIGATTINITINARPSAARALSPPSPV